MTENPPPSKNIEYEVNYPPFLTLSNVNIRKKKESNICAKNTVFIIKGEERNDNRLGADPCTLYGEGTFVGCGISRQIYRIPKALKCLYMNKVKEVTRSDKNF